MNIFITGGANGIGKATVRKLVDRGHDVAVYDIDETAMRGLPSKVRKYVGDVYDAERVREVLEQEEIDVLINCAGYQERGAIEDASAITIEKHFQTNVFGLLNVTRAALPMLREREGRIINVSSLAGRVVAPFWGAYAASKHAVEGASDALRLELASFNVDVVLIEPGPIQTGFNERGIQMLKRYLPKSIYAAQYRELLDHDIGGARPEKAATAIVKAVEARNPKPRYPVTWIAHLAPKLRVLLPTRVGDRLVNRWS